MPFLPTVECLHVLKWYSLAYLQQLYGAVITARVWMSIYKDLIHDIVWTQCGVLVHFITHCLFGRMLHCVTHSLVHVPYCGYQMRYTSTLHVNKQGSCNVPYISPILGYSVTLLFSVQCSVEFRVDFTHIHVCI